MKQYFIRFLFLNLLVLLSVQSQALVPFAFWKKATLAVTSFILENKLADHLAPPLRYQDTSLAFGTATAISEDQSTLVVGAPNDDFDSDGANYIVDAGAVYVYIKSGADWVLQQKLAGAGGTNSRVTSDAFGTSVAISGDTIVVGAHLQDYDASGAGGFGSAGAAYVYTRTAGVWSFQQKLVGTGTNGRVASDFLGISVAISGDTIVAGAYGQDYDEAGANLLSSAGAAYVFTRTAGVWSLQQKLVGTGTNGRLADDNFGVSVGINGDTIVAGAYLQDYDEAGGSLATEAGAAYVFTRTAGVWSQQQKLVGMGGNGRNATDYFGKSVAISGESIVVGAYLQDYITTGGSLVNAAGAAYVYTRTAGVWSQQQKLVGTGTNGRIAADYFGNCVAISGDTLVVSSHVQDYDSSGGNLLTDAGAVFMFTRTAGVWSLQQKLVGTGTNGRITSDNFGYSAAVSGDRVIVGAHQQDYNASGVLDYTGAGAAFVMERNAGVWIQTGRLVDESPRLARSLSALAKFGSSVAISDDQSTLVVGVPADDTTESGGGYYSPDNGAAFVYVKSGGVWVFQQKLVSEFRNNSISNEQFGASVAISGDTIVIGDPGSPYRNTSSYIAADLGVVSVFTRSGGVWTQQQRLFGTGTNGGLASDNFGRSVSIDGDTIVVGAPGQDYDEAGANLVSGAGAAFVFTRTAGVWSQEQKIVGTGTNGRIASDSFGNSVSLSGDTVVIGTTGQDYDEAGANSVSAAGAAFVYTRTAGVWSLQQKLVGTGTNGRITNDVFGTSVSLRVDTLVVGASGQDYDASGASGLSGAGAAFVFTRTAGVWSVQQKLAGTGTNGRVGSDNFGYCVSLNGESIAVGAYGQDYDADGANAVTDAGAVYVFNRSGGVWSLFQKVVTGGTNGRVASDWFGVSVAISGATLGVGASQQDYDADGANYVSNSGAAYVFRNQ